MAQTSPTKLLNAYLVVGEDALKRQRVLQRLRMRAAELGDLDFNHDTIDASAAGATDIVAACNTLPFASDLRLVEVTSLEKLSKNDSEVVAAYLANPCESTVLAGIADKLPKNGKLYKAFQAMGKNAVIECIPPKKFELAKNIRAMAVGHGFTMTPDAANELIALVGEDTVRIDAELRKLALAHEGNNPMGVEEVTELVAKTTEAKPWEFTDAFSARDLARCLSLIPKLTSTTPYNLIYGCTARLRELICARSLAARGEQARLADELRVPAWRVKNHVAWARAFAPGELEHLLSTARDCERAMKSGTDPDIALKEWVIESLS